MTRRDRVARFRHYVCVENVTPTREALLTFVKDTAEIERERDEAMEALIYECAKRVRPKIEAEP